MYLRLFLLTLLCLPASAKPEPLLPDQVVVVYNSSVPKSKDLAEFYALNRRIPKSNVIGLEVTEKATIDRNTYEASIRKPLIQKFTANQWWRIGKDNNGFDLPLETRIRCLVLMKGMPLKIKRAALPETEETKKMQFFKQNEASLDSELSLMGVSGYPAQGFIPNPYFNSEAPAIRNPANFMILVGRIDANTYDHCDRMILDAIEVEKDGLWGMTYLDLAKKGGNYAMGDKWIDTIAKASIEMGMPTVVDRMSNTFVTNYPMSDAAVYFGWYTQHRNGPFLSDSMKFQKGAIAVHLHSYSAAQLLNPAKNWSVGLIDRGAAATVGNVSEPYLGLTHHFDIFYDRLVKGYTLIEAGYMSVQGLSWQNVVIGDPLYTPYKTKSFTQENMAVERDYKLIRYARLKFTDEKVRLKELLTAAENAKSGTIYEMLGFSSLEAENNSEAIKRFTRAKELFTNPADKLRQDLHLVELERRRKKDAAAIALLRKAKVTYKDIPEAKAIDGLLTILDPPAPPATQRKK